MCLVTKAGQPFLGSNMMYEAIVVIRDSMVCCGIGGYHSHMKKGPWAGAPYKSAKERGGHSFDCFHI